MAKLLTNNTGDSSNDFAFLKIMKDGERVRESTWNDVIVNYAEDVYLDCRLAYIPADTACPRCC